MYTADELATLDAASINWPAVPEELDRYANGEACAANRATDGLGTSSPGQRASSGVNPIWFAAATLLGRDIGSSAAWNSELFDVHRVRIDLEQTLDDIYLRAHRIWRARANLVPPPTKHPDGARPGARFQRIAKPGHRVDPLAVVVRVRCAHLARAIARENSGFAQRLPGPRSGYTASMADTGDDRSVAPLVRQAAAWSWRLLVLLVTAVAVLQLMRRLGLVVVPVALALMATALLVPAVDWLDRRGAPRAGAVALVLLTGLAVVGGLLTFVVSQFVTGLPGLIDQVTESIDRTRIWLINGPLGLSRDQINQAGDSAIGALRGHQEQLTSGALSTAGTLTEIVTGALLALFTLIFFLHGGRNIWQFVTLVLPCTVRERVRDAGRSGFHSLIGYVRATFLVALVDAVGIGTGLAIMGVPLALPLASLVFLGAFIPLVGAVVSGFLAVVVALLAKGIVYALLVLGLIIAVQQLEAHVLQPFVMGRAVSIHPLAVVLGIAAGSVIAGIVGALLAVPVIAFLNNAVRVLVAKDPAAEEAAQQDHDGALVEAEPDTVDAGQPQ